MGAAVRSKSTRKSTSRPMNAATKSGSGRLLSVMMMACGLNAALQAASVDSWRYRSVLSTASLIASTGTSSAVGSARTSPAAPAKSPARSRSSRRRPFDTFWYPQRRASSTGLRPRSWHRSRTSASIANCCCGVSDIENPPSVCRRRTIHPPLLVATLRGRIPLSRRPPRQGLAGWSGPLGPSLDAGALHASHCTDDYLISLLPMFKSPCGVNRRGMAA